MGNSTSNNVAEQMVNLSIDIMNNYTQNCSTQQQNNIEINASNCNGLTIANLNQSQYSVINTNCISNAMTQSAIQSDISQALTQQAEAITQSLGGFAQADANNFASTAVRLGETIQNNYTSTCINNETNNFTVNCSNSAGVFIGPVSQQQTLDSIAKCALQAQTTNDIKNTISQQISQSAIAKEENSLSFGLIFIAIVVIIILIISQIL